ncbi:MAG: hypothetical protein HFI95_01460 [Lachnospiraceae bacterium]|jgi:sporulation integral membrane protein YlbJ|nr:hypothetical protein [Lachnospiraceae bacterium]
MRKLKIYLYPFLAVSLTAVILTFPADCLALALKGLTLWFERMIPTLFPFMVLSGIMIRMELTGAFVKALKPVLGPLFRVRDACLYGIVIGFLCGFPMGAHVAAQLYKQKQISRQEAAFLLSFCNNIGPVYFLSFVLPTLSLKASVFALFGMYGLPLLYGLFLRYTLFAKDLRRESSLDAQAGKASETGKASGAGKSCSLLQALDESVYTSLSGIAKLGGYMIFFNLLFILPVLGARLLALSPSKTELFTGGIGALLEITGGIGILGDRAPYLVLCILPFGGLSCIAQTYSMIRDTDLSIGEYVMHKMILTAVTVFYYLL